MELIYGTMIFPTGKLSFDAGRGRGRNSISFMVICLAVLWRVYALTSYFCGSVREELAMYLNFCFGLPKWRFMLRRAPKIAKNNHKTYGISNVSELWDYRRFYGQVTFCLSCFLNGTNCKILWRQKQIISCTNPQESNAYKIVPSA